MLKKCIGDPSLIVQTENVGIKDNLSYEEIPVQILDRQVRKLRTKEVVSVKVFWRNQFVEEATWEAKGDMKNISPHLFESGENSDQESLDACVKHVGLTGAVERETLSEGKTRGISDPVIEQVTMTWARLSE
ncbi:hypothetical protein MTR67_025655 [Solanum verrucosum]|uniref:Uncharacterized protein n=1 Tax=Solanum verrucosum TaxID=315347 RepID=A0AAF0R0K6_SOLVR|nr:hypothetical protein MTR67_025655 [Solanum verrucosum]